MRQSAITAALMFLGLLGGACGGTPSSSPAPADAGKDVPTFVDLSPAPDVRTGIDAQATDIEEVDRPAIDHPTVADVTPDSGPIPCTNNDGCAGDPGGCYRARELRSRDPLSRRLVDGGEVATATMDLIGLPVRSPLAAM